MTVEEYVSEDGHGPYGMWHVRDLLPPVVADIRLVLVFESPYVDEVAAGIPVVGHAGQLALDYLLSSKANGRSLGRVVAAQHAAGNSRIAILNTCNVPLASVSDPDETGLDGDDWKLLESVRTSDAQTAMTMVRPEAKAVGRVLMTSLERRVNNLYLAPDATLVASGVCARRFLRSFKPTSGHVPLTVPHPSRRQWQNDPNSPHLREVRTLFRKYL
ncbi:hypothetical protein [Agromyces sp. Leaf222]|uniref:hypothetical protein n=1 Tax=Agromyces sp. Leaf222 TaxID=1735688 RepID=UPI000AB11C6C|nr:hypothetical protein [Agromyces sp. Leaf222]